MESSLKSQTTFALKWSAIGTVFSGLLQVGSTAVLGRLIGPSEYGLLAMANVFISFGGYLSQMGLGPALIQKPEIDTKDIRASFTLALLLGLLLTVTTILFSPLIGKYYHNQAIPAVVGWVSVTFLLNGVSLTSLSLLRRQLSFKTTTLIEIGAFVLGNGLVAIPCALSGWGVWSLVASILVQRAIIAIAGMAAVRHSLVPIFSYQAYRRCLGFGTHYSFNTILEFFYANIEVFLIGRIFTERLAGLYNRGQMLVALPMEYSVVSVTRVLFPVFTKLQSQKEKITQVFITVFVLIGLLSASISGGMFSSAREIMLVVLGKKWEEGIFIFRFLTLVIPLDYLMSTEALLLDSLGKLGYRTWIRLFALTVKCIALFIGFQFGITGFLVAMLLSQAFQQFIYIPFLRRSVGLSSLVFFHMYLLLITEWAGVAGMTWGVTVLGRATGCPMVIILLLQILTGGLVFLFLLKTHLHFSFFGIRRDILQSIPILSRL